MNDDVPIKTVPVALHLVDTIRSLDGATLSELSDAVEMPTSTVHDHLRTLEMEGYLVSEDNEYHISTRFLEIGDYVQRRKKVFGIAKQELDELAETTGHHANLMIEEHNQGVFLYKSRGPDAVTVDTHAGMRVPLQTTALGKSIMAYRPQDEVETIVDEHGLPDVTENTISSREALYDELERIRERGYATDDEERVRGMRCVAAPIRNDDGRAIAAVSVSAPKSRLRDERFTEKVPDLVNNVANIVEVNITYQ
jgi:DNA-binding IclR family transcriptional regulator